MKRYIIKATDVGKSEILSPIFEPLGIVMSQDVGKMCVKVGDIWQVENEEQFRERLKKKP